MNFHDDQGERASEIPAPEFGPGHAYRPRPTPAVRVAAIGNTGRLLAALNDALEAEKSEVQRLRDDVAKLLNRCILLDEEVAEQRKVIHRAARDLYAAEIHRQGVGWDDYCTDLLVRSQHALAAETRP